MQSKNNKAGLYFLCIIASYLLFYLTFAPWEHCIIHPGDEAGYYSYLPSSFIYHDLENMDSTYAMRVKYAGFEDFDKHEDRKLENGNFLVSYTCGVAIVQLPVFLLAHMIAMVTNYPADGYSIPYSILISIWPILCLLVCSYILFNLLSKYFKIFTSLIAITTVLLGTHMFPNAIEKGNMSHIFLFCLVVLLWYIVEKIRIKSSFKLWIIAGTISGLIVMIRPSEITIFIWFAWFLTLKDFRKQWSLLRFLAFLAAFAIPIFLQCMYWKLVTGSYIYYSYGEIGFDFKNPHIIEGLFSFQNGFFPYAIVCFFSLIGLFFLKKKMPYMPWFIVIYLLVQSFVVYSWWNWFYINGFGSRPMIITLVPFSILIAASWERFRLNTIFKFLLIALFIIWNLFTSWQMLSKILYTEESNLAYYISMFGKTTLDQKSLITLDLQERQYNDYTIVDTLVYYQSVSDSLQSTDQNTYPDYLAINDEYSVALTYTIEDPALLRGKSIRSFADVYFKVASRGIYDMNMLVTVIETASVDHKWTALKMQNKIPVDGQYSYNSGAINQPAIVSGMIAVPEEIQQGDKVKLLIWNYARKTTYLKQMGIELINTN